MSNMEPGVLLGSAYYVNTEDTPEQVRSGILAMAQAGLKLVRIFLQWTHVEPVQGRWDWSQYDAVFEAAAAGGSGCHRHPDRTQPSRLDADFLRPAGYWAAG